MRESNRQNLRIGVQEPYFGRLDFQEDGKEEVMPIYIGKLGVSDMDTMKPSLLIGERLSQVCFIHLPVEKN